MQPNHAYEDDNTVSYPFRDAHTEEDAEEYDMEDIIYDDNSSGFQGDEEFYEDPADHQIRVMEALFSGRMETKERIEKFPDLTTAPIRSIKTDVPVNFASKFAQGLESRHDIRALPNIGYDIEISTKENVFPNAEVGPESPEEDEIDYSEELQEILEILKSNLPLTPLPDQNFTKRVTTEGTKVGFKSLALICDKCLCCFRTTTSLSNHQKTKADGVPYCRRLRSHVTCSYTDCDIKCDSMSTLVEHVKLHHGNEKMVYEYIEFKNLEQFKLWKLDFERLTASRFIRSSGKQSTASRSTYFHCNFSGTTGSQNHNQNPNNKLRNKASKKMERTCPAFLHIKEDENGKVTLRGCVQHLGHDADVRTMPLTECIKKEVAAFLLEGLDEHEIVEALRACSDPSDRRYYVQPYEVRNICSKVEKIQQEIYFEGIDGGNEVIDDEEEEEEVEGAEDDESNGFPKKVSFATFEGEPIEMDDAVEEEVVIGSSDGNSSLLEEAPAYAAIEEVRTTIEPSQKGKRGRKPGSKNVAKKPRMDEDGVDSTSGAAFKKKVANLISVMNQIPKEENQKNQLHGTPKAERETGLSADLLTPKNDTEKIVQEPAKSKRGRPKKVITRD